MRSALLARVLIHGPPAGAWFWCGTAVLAVGARPRGGDSRGLARVIGNGDMQSPGVFCMSPVLPHRSSARAGHAADFVNGLGPVGVAVGLEALPDPGQAESRNAVVQPDQASAAAGGKHCPTAITGWQ